MAIKNYTDLIAWQKAMDLVEMVYKMTYQFPTDEKFGLISQIRRAAVSVPSNIAEGQGRWSDAEFHRFLAIAHGSLREIETQAMIAKRLSYIAPPQLDSFLNLSTEVGRLINGLANSLNK